MVSGNLDVIWEVSVHISCKKSAGGFEMCNCNKMFLSIIVTTLLLTGCANYVKTQPEGTSLSSSSEIFQNATKALVNSGYCAPEFRSCNCTIDGIRASCSVAHRCLELGFCVVVRE